MTKKTVTKKTTAKKSTTKSTAGAKVGAAPSKSSEKKTMTKSSTAGAKSVVKPTTEVAAQSTAPIARKDSQVSAKKPAKTAKSKNLLLGGPARLGSSFGLPSHPPSLNLASQSSQKKKKNQNPIAAAVEKQFGPSPSGKAQGTSSAQGATRSQMRRDTKKG